jgi:hypothetical protein
MPGKMWLGGVKRGDFTSPEQALGQGPNKIRGVYEKVRLHVSNFNCGENTSFLLGDSEDGHGGLGSCALSTAEEEHKIDCGKGGHLPHQLGSKNGPHLPHPPSIPHTQYIQG